MVEAASASLTSRIGTFLNKRIVKPVQNKLIQPVKNTLDSVDQAMKRSALATVGGLVGGVAGLALGGRRGAVAGASVGAGIGRSIPKMQEAFTKNHDIDNKFWESLRSIDLNATGGTAVGASLAAAAGLNPILGTSLGAIAAEAAEFFTKPEDESKTKGASKTKDMLASAMTSLAITALFRSMPMATMFRSMPMATMLGAAALGIGALALNAYTEKQKNNMNT